MERNPFQLLKPQLLVVQCSSYSLRSAGEQLKNFLTMLYTEYSAKLSSLSYAQYMGSWYKCIICCWEAKDGKTGQ